MQPSKTHQRDAGVVPGDPDVVIHHAVHPHLKVTYYLGRQVLVSTRQAPRIVTTTWQGTSGITGIQRRTWYRWDMYRP